MYQRRFIIINLSNWDDKIHIILFILIIEIKSCQDTSINFLGAIRISRDKISIMMNDSKKIESPSVKILILIPFYTNQDFIIL